MTRPSPRPARRPRGIAAYYALPAGCSALLLVGAIAAASHGGVSGGWVLALAAIVVAATGLSAEPGATLFVVAAGWFTVAGFSRSPYAQLKLTWQLGARAALVLSLAGLAGTGTGLPGDVGVVTADQLGLGADGEADQR